MKRTVCVLSLCVLLLTLLLGIPASADEAQTSYTPEQLLEVWHQLIAMMREAECYPYVELQKGDRGYEVMFLQARLAQLNYYGKAIDPQYGSGTYNAMRMFEKVNGLKTDGIASVEDQKLLFRSDAKPNTGVAVGLENGQTPPPEIKPGPGDAPDWWPNWPKLPIKPNPDIWDIIPDLLATPTPKPTFHPGLQTIKPLDTGLKLPDLSTPTPKPTLNPGLQTIKPLNPGLNLPDLSTPKPTLNPGLQTFMPLNPGLNLPDLSTPKPDLSL